jgi:molybdopterin molybdotransferase
MVNANRNLSAYESFGVPVWPDASADYAGPLAGFLVGLERCETAYLVTVPCDTPLFPSDLVARLAEAWSAKARTSRWPRRPRKTASCAPARVLAAAARADGKPGALHARRRPQDRRLDGAAQDGAGALRPPGRRRRPSSTPTRWRNCTSWNCRDEASIAEIAAQLQGYDPQALRPKVNGASWSRLVSPVADTEAVAVFDALDRILAADLVSPISVPPHDNSAMDGYAFDGAQLAGAPRWNSRWWARRWPGRPGAARPQPGQCVKIMTGAIMPAGLDTVVPQEFTKRRRPTGAHRDSGRPAAAGDNRRLKGEDLMQGQPALRAGERLGPAALGLVASLGIAQVNVRAAPPARGLLFHRRRDPEPGRAAARRRGLRQQPLHGARLLRRLGCEVIDLGVVRDQPALLEAAFTDAPPRAPTPSSPAAASASARPTSPRP